MCARDDVAFICVAATVLALVPDSMSRSMTCSPWHALVFVRRKPYKWHEQASRPPTHAVAVHGIAAELVHKEASSLVLANLQ